MIRGDNKGKEKYMGKRNLKIEEVAILLENKNVIKCSSKAITYSKEFKVLAVKQYKEGMSSREIFETARFDLKIIGKDTPTQRLKDWNRIARNKGEAGLLSETRGRGSPGRPKLKGLTDKEKMEYLEAKVAYLKAENEFLAQLRKKKGLG
ncbi:MAG: HTH domain-containing protein [Minisyncoccales bacterium]